MTTDNTQELDEILDNIVAIVAILDGDELDESFAVQRQALLDWHNKQTLELLDRLEAKKVRVSLYDTTIPRDAIEAERNRLTDTNVGKLKED